MRARQNKPLVLGHRGYRARFPENTLRAFREALAAGADGIECDVQKTRDGRYVVIHDPTTGRTANADRPVAESKLVDLQSLDFGRGERIPTVDELLAELPRGAWLDLELKEETLRVDDCAPIIAALSSVRRDRLMVSSFSAELLLPFRGTDITVGFLVGEEAADLGLRALLRTLRRVRPAYVNLPIDMVPRLGARRAAALALLLRALGYSLLFWTVNDAEHAWFAARHGRIIVTDEVEAVIRLFRGSGFTAN